MPGSVGGRPAGWGLGLASLICGGVSLVFFWLYLPMLAAIAAIVLGILALRAVGRSGTRGGSGKVMGIIGLCTGGLGLILGILMIVLVAALYAEVSEECGSPDSYGYEQCVQDGIGI
ncbi:hypothetical protein A5N15_05580 [Rothia kristinae]|uniref:DUF4190 domain-containing protein n=1 Tax=Rothia kristinae TaxID=37923 RepID=A0A657IUK7_9MICC|nr:hypothetical protein A5N15_05580 [Rothia kristinae]